MSQPVLISQRSFVQSPWLHVALLCVLVAVAFSQVYDNSYQMDDVYRVQENSEIRKVHPMSRFFSDPKTMATLPRITVYRPLLPLSLSINHWLGGHSVRSYHVGNVLLYALLVCILYGFLSALLTQYGDSLALQARWIALTAAGLFALHPVAGIPVNYICARDLIMMGISFFSACWLWVLSGSSTGRRQTIQRVAAACLLILALLAKKNAVVAPLMLAAFAWTVGAKSIRDKGTWIHALVAAFLIGAYLLFVRYGLDVSETYQFVTQKFSSYEYALTQFRVYALHYLPNLFWTTPIRQAPHIDWAQSPLEAAVLAGMVIVLVSLYLAWRLRRSNPLISFCILAWWIMMLPTSSIVPAHAAVVHYRALPSLPFAALLASMVIWTLLSHRVAALISVALVLVLGFATWQANKTWRTEETLFAHSIKHGGASMAHHNYATSLMSFDSAGAEKHLRIALKRSPNYILAYVNLGLVNINQGKIKDGIAHLNYAVSIDPSIQQTRDWLKIGLSRVDKKLRPLRKTGLEAISAQRYDEALKLFSQIQHQAPGRLRAGFNIAFILQKSGQRKQAISAYRAWFKHAPGDMQAHFNLGWALMNDDRCPEAIFEFEKTLVLNPKYEEARTLIAKCQTSSRTK